MKEGTMFGKEFNLAKLFGVVLAIDYSWFWIFLLITYVFSANFLPLLVPNQSLPTYIGYGLLGSFLFFLSVVIHEFSHTLTARANNLPINKITLFLFGGASNLSQEPQSAKVEFKMAIAGPLASLVLSGIFYGVGRIIPTNAATDLLVATIRVLSSINLGLAIFNMLPGFPLDGGRVFRSIVWWRTKDLIRSTRIAANGGKVVAFGLGGLGFLQILIGNLFSGFWILLISYFLFQSAQASVNQTLVSLTLSQAKISDLTNKQLSLVEANEPLSKLADRILTENRDTYLVRKNHKIIGMVSPQVLEKIPRSRWDTLIRKVIYPITNARILKSDQRASAALESLGETSMPVIVTNQHDKIIGTLTHADLRRFVLAHLPNQSGK